jgi:WD40 repeat protein
MDQLPQSFEKVVGERGDVKDVYSKYLREQDTPTKKSPEPNDSDSDSDTGDEDELPISHTYKLPTPSTKPITSLHFSPSSDKLITAVKDYSLNFYNFKDLYSTSDEPSKSIEPFDTSFIQTFKISKQSEKILALPHASFFKVLDLDGKELNHFSFGDQYIYDVKKTNGHVDLITDGDWNSKDSNKFITSSLDSTFRVWDLKKLKQIEINFIKNASGKKTKVEQVKYIKDAQNIVSIDGENRLQIWDVNSNFRRPIDQISLTGTTSSLESVNETQFLIRSTEDLKLYDLRSLKNPIIQKLDFPTISRSNSPIAINNNYIISETSIDGGSMNELHILDKSDLATVGKVSTNSKITALDWDHHTNQIAIGEYNGQVSILFDPALSKEGVLTSIANRPRKRDTERNDVFIGKQTGYNLNELAELQRSRNKQKKQRKNDNDEEEGEGGERDYEDDSKTRKKQKFIWGVTNPDKS